MIIEHCDVWKDGELYQADTGVLFKDNGWVRISVNDEYEYYNREDIDKIVKSRDSVRSE